MDELPNFGAKVGTETRSGNCAEHGDFVSTGFKFGDRVMHWSICPQCAALEKANAEVEAKKRESEERQKRLETKLNQTGIPLRYRAKNFMTYVADTDEKEHALAVATEFASNFAKHRADGTFLVFSGLPGTGKSHLAGAVLQHIMPDHVGLYVTCMAMIRAIRGTWRKESEKSEAEVLTMFAEVPLLVLDEIGVQYGTDGEQTIIFDVLDRRYRDMKPTILLTNQAKQGFKDFIGERSFDRLVETSRWVPFDWDSYRATARKEAA